MRQVFQTIAPFRVELQEVEIFKASKVIYLSVGTGMAELIRLHQRLNRGRAFLQEPFEYHPHITLAQELPPNRVADAKELAAQRWAEYSGPRYFMVDRLTFVQYRDGVWSDLDEDELKPPAGVNFAA
jgi:2'-5' RNA ligase